MTSPWPQHGAYTLSWQGRVLVARYEGAWNEVCARNLHHEARRLWEQHGQGLPWALLSDATDWEAGTPEALAAWWVFFEDAVHHGLKAATDILPTQLHAVIVQALAERAGRLVSYRRSPGQAEGLAWLQAQGFGHD